MRRMLFLMLVTLLTCSAAQAVPARGNLVQVKQPDGSILEVRTVGDEFHHFTMTADGYTVVRDERMGGWCYARLEADGSLQSTTLLAHNADSREAAELTLLAATDKHLAPAMKPAMQAMQEQERQARLKAAAARRAPNYDYSKFHGLVILVEYNDRTFDRDDYKDVVDASINGENYIGYYDYANRWQACTGSVRDYFRDNSMGVFEPTFDIVGPVQIDRSQYYAHASDNAAQLMLDVINAVDSEVDFKQYDGDGDGMVDMIYFIFAGAGAHYSGNDSRLLWPHASQIYNPTTYQYVRKDGVYLGRYACSVELAGSTTSRNLDGIGVICHEFSHVLGLPDMYDTDYDGGGGQSADPGSWSLMASGSYNNNSRTPAGYSLFERYFVGFATPKVIDAPGSYTLESLNTSNTGYRINTQNRREYFILENRQQTRWDAALPYHGMLVFRVDSTSTTPWQQNTVNANPAHNYYELVRARGTSGYASTNPFPGSGRVTTLNNTTSPANLKTWDGKDTQWGLANIREAGSPGVITFDIENGFVLSVLSIDESLSVPVSMSRRLEVTAEPETADYTLSWTSSDESVATVTQEGLVTGVSAGTATITVESDNGLKAECAVTVLGVETVPNIAAFKALEENDTVLLQLTDAEILYSRRVSTDPRTKAPLYTTYVRDASGAMVLNRTTFTFEQGDVVNGLIYGARGTVNRMPQLTALEGTAAENLTIEAGDEPQPVEVTIADLNEDLYAQYVVVKGAAIERRIMEGVSTFNTPQVCIVDDEAGLQYRLYNLFSITNVKAPAEADTQTNLYDVTGIWGTQSVSSGKILLDEIYLMKSPVASGERTGIETLTAPAGQREATAVYDMSGRRVADGPDATRQLRKGIYTTGGRKFVVK